MHYALPFFLMAILLLSGCSPPAGTSTVTPGTGPPLPPSMKSYELYSWPVGDTWRFTLITTTNRPKTYREVTAPDDLISPDGFVKVSAGGIEGLKGLLQRLPAGTEVGWISGRWLTEVGQTDPGEITLPDAATLRDIQTYCDQSGLKLTIIH